VSRRIRIRTKLVAALAIPVAALVGVSAFELVQASTEADDVRAQTTLATSAMGPGSLVTSLQDERNFGGLELIGLETATDLPVTSTEEARAIVDDGAEELRALLADQPAEVRAVFTDPLAALDDLAGIRADMDAYDGERNLANTDLADEVFERYTAVISTFFDATTQIALRTEDVALRNGVELIDYAARQSELRARMVRRVVLMRLTGDATDREGLHEVAAFYDRATGFDQAIGRAGVGPYEAAAAPLFEDEQVQRFNSQIEEFLATSEADLTALLDSVRTAPDRGYAGVRNRASEVLAERSDALVGDAENRRQVFLGLIGLVLLIAAGVTWLASRSITRPLRSLTRQAEAMAGERLPSAVQEILDTPPGEDVNIPVVEPIEVRTRDEVRDVADALNVVQRSALDLAFEQAVLRRNISDSFVNLGRRNQNLLNRQLDFITDLERDETDPDALEGLFRLDHLATRMRRNAESLLVLAGVEPPRQWSAPVAISDVVRAALGEVEDYQRVVVRHLEPALVTGTVAADLAHVVAELAENALTFSPAEQPVEVKGRLTPEGYTLAITDNGMGMSETDVAKANRRLAGTESFTVAPSRYLGHYVAGHLAMRMGVTVELGAGPAGGTTARVDVPMALIADDEGDDGFSSPGPVITTPAAPDADQVVEQWVAESRAAGSAVGGAGRDWSVAPSDLPEPDVTAHGLPKRRSAEPAPSAEWRTGDLPEERSPDPLPWEEAEEGGQHDEDAESVPLPTVQGAWPAVDEPFEPSPKPELTWGVDRDGSELSTGPAVDEVRPETPFEPLTFAPIDDHGFDVSSLAPVSGHADLEPTPGPGAVPGFGGLAAPGGEPAGLPRRVPGAQRPDQTFGTAETEAAEVPSDDLSQRSSAEDVYAFLSSFQSGVERGLAETAHPIEEDDR
jgi:signal transduction histidine kinase